MSIRLALRLGGIVLAALALTLTDQFVARHFSPDGQISEIAYLYFARALAVGMACTLFAASYASRRKVQNLALALAATLAATMVVEMVFRAINAVSWNNGSSQPIGLRASSYPDLYYENTPSFREDGEEKFNSLGMRDYERPFPPDRTAVVVLGDSIEAWRALAVADLYPRLLESRLNASDAKADIEVVNLGVTGYSLHQKVQMLKYRGLAFEPRLVVVGYCLNDPISAGELVKFFTDAGKSVWQSAALTFVNDRVRTFLHAYGLDFYHEIHRPQSESWRQVVTDFEALGTMGRQHGFNVIVVIFPLMADTKVDYPWLDVHRQVQEAAQRSGLTVVDLLDSYRRAGLPAVRADGVHPNALGHRIAAEELYAVIRDGRLLQRREAS